MNFRQTLTGVFLALTLSDGIVSGAQEPARPNFVIIFTDDQGYQDVGCFGSTNIKTPNLDRMAREGMRFTDFYVGQAVCTASRAALLTGCYPNRIGLLGALGPKSKVGISDKELTIAQVLKTRGYATAIFGKWHLGDSPQFLPTRHGFDEYFGLPYSNDMWPNHPTDVRPDQRQIAARSLLLLLGQTSTSRAERQMETAPDARLRSSRPSRPRWQAREIREARDRCSAVRP